MLAFALLMDAESEFQGLVDAFLEGWDDAERDVGADSGAGSGGGGSLAVRNLIKQLSLVCIGTTLIHVKLVPRQRHFRVDRPQVELPASKRAALQQAPSSATTARTPVQAMRPHVFVKHRGEWTHGTMSDSGYDIILS